MNKKEFYTKLQDTEVREYFKQVKYMLKSCLEDVERQERYAEEKMSKSESLEKTAQALSSASGRRIGGYLLSNIPDAADTVKKLYEYELLKIEKEKEV